MNNKKNPLSKKIKIAMLDSGLNQTQLARKIGISRQSLSEWLSSCENPKLQNIKKIAQATGKPVNYFFENSGNIIDDNKGSININNTDNTRLTLLEKDMEIIKKEIEILKLKIKK